MMFRRTDELPRLLCVAHASSPARFNAAMHQSRADRCRRATQLCRRTTLPPRHKRVNFCASLRVIGEPGPIAAADDRRKTRQTSQARLTGGKPKDTGVQFSSACRLFRSFRAGGSFRPRTRMAFPYACAIADRIMRRCHRLSEPAGPDRASSDRSGRDPRPRRTRQCAAECGR